MALISQQDKNFLWSVSHGFSPDRSADWQAHYENIIVIAMIHNQFMTPGQLAGFGRRKKYALWRRICQWRGGDLYSSISVWVMLVELLRKFPQFPKMGLQSLLNKNCRLVW
ncbi:MAG: hypothetical protein JKX69_01065 [Rhodobacteraceae bacterium]|nr:hypothetical protein [Paracoccaceae bacterium]